MIKLSVDQKLEIAQNVCTRLLEEKLEKTGSLKIVIEALCQPAACHILAHNWHLLEGPFADACNALTSLEKIELITILLSSVTASREDEKSSTLMYWAWEILEKLSFPLKTDAEEMRRLLIGALSSDIEGLTETRVHLAFGARLLHRFASN